MVSMRIPQTGDEQETKTFIQFRKFAVLGRKNYKSKKKNPDLFFSLTEREFLNNWFPVFGVFGK